MQSRFLMHLDDFPDELRKYCFEFFYWFSRFEYALKENNYVAPGQYGSAAPAWSKFESDFGGAYRLTEEGRELVEAPPQRQVYVEPNRWEWGETDFSRMKTDLGKAILSVKTIRNNLFHGGKHNEKDWDEPDRNLFLLPRGTKVLDSFARLHGNLLAEYRRSY